MPSAPATLPSPVYVKLCCHTCAFRSAKTPENQVVESASLQSESQTPTRGQTNATRKQAKGGKRKDRKEERQREGAREKRKGDTGGQAWSSKGHTGADGLGFSKMSAVATALGVAAALARI